MGVGHLNNAAKFIDDNAVFIACAEEAKRSGKSIERILRDTMLASPRWIQEHQMSTKGIRAGKGIRKDSKVSRTMQTLSDQIAAQDPRRKSTMYTGRVACSRAKL